MKVRRENKGREVDVSMYNEQVYKQQSKRTSTGAKKVRSSSAKKAGRLPVRRHAQEKASSYA